MAPANQRLHAEEAARAKIDDRLVLDEEFLVGDGARNVGHQPRALLQQFLHRRLEGHEAILAGGLRVVHRDVRLAEQRLRAGFESRERDADARGNAHLGAAEVEGQVEVLDQRGRQEFHLADGRDALEQDREFIAAQARHRVGEARRFHQALRNRLQQPVADIVAERIVDALEIVQVDEHDCHLVVCALRQRQRMLQAIAEEAPVGEQGQRVVECELA